MNINSFTASILLVGTAIAPANAAQFVFQYGALPGQQAGSPMSATLYLTTSNAVNALGGYDILAASGTIDGAAVLGLKPNPNQPNPYSDGQYTYDNVLYTSGPALDGPGLVVTTATLKFNFGFDSGSYFAISTDGSTRLNNQGHVVTNFKLSEGIASLSAVPEPAAWAMMVVGFGFAGTAMRRRRTAVAFA